MSREAYSASCLLLVWKGAMHAQTPTITSVQNESRSNALCPGGVAFVRGTNLRATGAPVTVGTRQAYVFNALGGTPCKSNSRWTSRSAPPFLRSAPRRLSTLHLVQYCPGLPVTVPAPNFGFAFHYPSQTPATTSFPASPNEQIAVIATGLGPTNPVLHSR